MRSKICKLSLLSLLLLPLAGCYLQGSHGYGEYVCDPNSAYANGMMDSRMDKPFNTHYGAGCPVRTPAMLLSYRRGYDRGALLHPLYDHTPPLPVERNREMAYFQPQRVAPAMRPGEKRPVAIDRSASAYPPRPPAKAVVLNPYPAPGTKSSQHHTSHYQQPWPPAPNKNVTPAKPPQSWPAALQPATSVSNTKPVVLNSPPVVPTSTGYKKTHHHWWQK